MTLDPTAPLDDDLTPVTDPRKDELTSDVPEAPGDEEDTGVPDEGVDDTPDDEDEEEPVTSSPLYNFRLLPESFWFIANTVLGALLTSLVATDFTSITDWKAWAIGLGAALFRTLLGAILAAATGGGFQGPGVTKEEDAVS